MQGKNFQTAFVLGLIVFKAHGILTKKMAFFLAECEVLKEVWYPWDFELWRFVTEKLPGKHEFLVLPTRTTKFCKTSPERSTLGVLFVIQF